MDELPLHYFLLCFKWSLVFHFSSDNLQNPTISLFTPTICIDFILSYAESWQTLSGNEYRLYVNSCSLSCSPHILLLKSLIDPCNVYFLFALPVVTSALPGLWRFFRLFYLWSCVWLFSIWWFDRSRYTCCLLILVANKLFLRLASRYLLRFLH